MNKQSILDLLKIVLSFLLFSFLSTNSSGQSGTFKAIPSMNASVEDVHFKNYELFEAAALKAVLPVHTKSVTALGSLKKFTLDRQEGVAYYSFFESLPNQGLVPSASKTLSQESSNSLLGNMDLLDIENSAEGLWVLTREDGLFLKKNRSLFGGKSLFRGLLFRGFAALLWNHLNLPFTFKTQAILLVRWRGFYACQCLVSF